MTMRERALRLPDGWWPRFDAQLRTLGLTFEEFCARRPKVSQKTLYRAKKSPHRMSIKILTRLSTKLGMRSTDDLLAAWEGRYGTPLSALESSESLGLDQEFRALAHADLLERALDLATDALARADESNDPRLQAHWADRVAAVHRSTGELGLASEFYARASVHLQAALRRSPEELDLRLQAARSKFGQIIVDSFLIHGAFNEALTQHTWLLSEAARLQSDDHAEQFGRALRIGQLNIRRQQAEMLRLLGRYTESLDLAREVTGLYDESCLEERAYGQLSQADSLRLMEDWAPALDIYRKLEELARGRDLRKLLGSVLWRQSLVAAVAGDRALSERLIGDASALSAASNHRYRFLRIYCGLVGASGPVADRRAALRLLESAEKFGPLRRDFLRAEYAHAALCRGEILRSQGSLADALSWFQQALSCYRLMGCRWGIVRAGIGVRLTGGSGFADEELASSSEGGDAALMKEFCSARTIPRGLLSANLP